MCSSCLVLEVQHLVITGLEWFSEGVANLSPSFLKCVCLDLICSIPEGFIFFFFYILGGVSDPVGLTLHRAMALYFFRSSMPPWGWQNVLPPIVDKYRFRRESSAATGFVPARTTVKLQTGGTESKAERGHGTRKEVPPTG